MTMSDNELSRLLASPIYEHTETIHLQQPVLCEVDDDPFGPPLTLWVAFIVINKKTLGLKLRGFLPDDKGNRVISMNNFREVDASPNRFRIVNEVMS